MPPTNDATSMFTIDLKQTHTCPCDRVGCLAVKDELAKTTKLLTEAVSLFKGNRGGITFDFFRGRMTADLAGWIDRADWAAKEELKAATVAKLTQAERDALGIDK